MINYVIVRCCDRKDVLIAKTMTSSDECWTGHRLARSSMYSPHKAEKDAETAEAKHNQGKLDLPEKQAECSAGCYTLMTLMLNASGKVSKLRLKQHVMKHWAARSGAIRTGLMVMTQR